MKKIYISICTALFALISLISTSYAWFELNQEVWVDGFELNVTSGDGMLVSISGANYKQYLTTNDVIKAIVAKYKGYSFDEDDNIIDFSGNTLSNDRINTMFNEIKLLPITSSDGKSFYDRLGDEVVYQNNGMYVSFDIYFASDTTGGAGKNDLSVYFYSANEKILEDGTTIKPTSINSTIENIDLVTTGVTYNKATGVKETINSTNINIKSSDALRFSTKTTDIYSNEIAKIYELSEGYGSYATNFSEEYYETGTNGAYMAKYDASKNLMFSMFNATSASALEPLEYTEMPTTIKAFDTMSNAKVCDLSRYSGYKNKVEFNFWLEGWDADCLDGIGKNSTHVQLSFTTSLDVEKTKNVVYIEDDLSEKTFNECIPTKALLPSLPNKVEGKKFIGYESVGANPLFVDSNRMLLNYFPSGSTELTLTLKAKYQ